MQLWLPWWEVILLLQPAFSRWRTFVWFTVCVAGLSVGRIPDFPTVMGWSAPLLQQAQSGDNER
jgi:hypothetical protein